MVCQFCHSVHQLVPIYTRSRKAEIKVMEMITAERKPFTADTHDVQEVVHRRELAILGGSPAFTEKLHVGRPNIGDPETFLARVRDMLERRWLTNDGPFVKEFEERVADFIGVRHCVAMCNGTVALEIAIRALGLSGEVIIPSYTFIATAHALQWQQITPVFADIREDTHCLDAEAVERMITPRTTGLIGVHLWGQACDVDALTELARRRKLRLLFDAAHAFGCTHKGRMIGNNGECEVLSFHATKYFNTLEGGAVLTNDDALAHKMRLMRNFGFAGVDNVIHVGTNGKMNEVSAAMGLTNLQSLDSVTRINERNWEAYRDELSCVDGLRLLRYGDQERCNYQYVVVDVDARAAGLTRDDFVSVLWAENVMARKYFWPGCHRMEPYRSLFPHAGLLLPNTERVAQRIMLLPTGTAVDQATIETVCRILKAATKHNSHVRRQLHGWSSTEPRTHAINPLHEHPALADGDAIVDHDRNAT
jgi:dTDP-4-amino-4,6-dideoxygalactose transaminase